MRSKHQHEIYSTANSVQLLFDFINSTFFSMVVCSWVSIKCSSDFLTAHLTNCIDILSIIFHFFLKWKSFTSKSMAHIIVVFTFSLCRGHVLSSGLFLSIWTVCRWHYWSQGGRQLHRAAPLGSVHHILRRRVYLSVRKCRLSFCQFGQLFWHLYIQAFHRYYQPPIFLSSAIEAAERYRFQSLMSVILSTRGGDPMWYNGPQHAGNLPQDPLPRPHRLTKDEKVRFELSLFQKALSTHTCIPQVKFKKLNVQVICVFPNETEI